MPEPADRPRPRHEVVSPPSEGDSELDETVAMGVGPAIISAPAFGPPTESGEVGRLGPYRVVKQLGKGGMGAVYAAVDTRLNRRLALKVMLAEFATKLDAKERFLREARAAAQISHDNVVTVFEADERDGVPYIAMQYLEGYPLDVYLKTKGSPSAFQILRIARETAAGLGAAHKLGLIHRDIKPANLWLEAPDGRVKVLDFGLARPVEAESELTQSGAVMGTPAYMSPEQGRGLKVDHRSDLFSLGVVLYRLCAGQLPFRGPTAMAVLMAIGTDEPPPVRELNSTVPESLAALIHQLLAKKPDARLQTADDVVARIRAITQELETTTGPHAEHGARPQVVYVPLQITAMSEANPFADLDATEAVTAPPEPSEPKPMRAKPRGNALWIAAGVVALAALIVGGVIFALKNKGSTETKAEPPDVTAAPSKEKGKPPAIDPERKAAEYALSIGGTVSVNNDRAITTAADLPYGRITLTRVNLSDNAKVTDAELAQFKDCRDLTHLHLQNTRVTDAGLAHFKDCKTLTYLDLQSTQATDAGLAHLKGCKELKTLDVRKTKTTAKGIEEFHAAVPGCRIDHDGGTIETADRTAAEYALSIGGTVRVNGNNRDIKAAAELPNYFTLTYVALRDNAKVTDAGLAHFKGCTPLMWIDLSGTKVTDAGLAHLKDCTALVELFLNGTQVTDAGLAHFKNCKNLGLLGLGATQVTDAGLEYFKDCKALSSISLYNARQVTDTGLLHLKDCKILVRIDVRDTKVTAKGAAEFHAAVPGCHIEYSGGTIEPKK